MDGRAFWRWNWCRELFVCEVDLFDQVTSIIDEVLLSVKEDV